MTPATREYVVRYVTTGQDVETEKVSALGRGQARQVVQEREGVATVLEVALPGDVTESHGRMLFDWED